MDKAHLSCEPGRWTALRQLQRESTPEVQMLDFHPGRGSCCTINSQQVFVFGVYVGFVVACLFYAPAFYFITWLPLCLIQNLFQICADTYWSPVAAEATAFRS